MEIIVIKHPLTRPIANQLPCVMALGFFDGVHRGHQHVLKTAAEIAKRKDLALAVMTFFPHPKEVISNGRHRVEYLMPMEKKAEALSQHGVERLYVIEFDRMFAALSPKEFVQQYICDFNVQHVVAGFDFTYGYKGEGNMSSIEYDGRGAFNATVVQKIEDNGVKISSTLIRECLKKGEVAPLHHYLGKPYAAAGHVTKSNQLSRQVRVRIDDYYMLPKPDYYEIELIVNDNVIQSVCFVNENKNEIEVTLPSHLTLSPWQPVQLTFHKTYPLKVEERGDRHV